MSDHDDAMNPAEEQAGAASAPAEVESGVKTASSHASFGAGSMLSDTAEMAAYDGIEMPPSYPPAAVEEEGFGEIDETTDEISSAELDDLAEDARANVPVKPAMLAPAGESEEADAAAEAAIAEEADATAEADGAADESEHAEDPASDSAEDEAVDGEAEPGEDEPVEAESAVEDAAEDEAVDGEAEPCEDEPVEDESSEDETEDAKPAETKPFEDESVEAEFAVDDAAQDEAVDAEPVEGEPDEDDADEDSGQTKAGTPRQDQAEPVEAPDAVEPAREVKVPVEPVQVAPAPPAVPVVPAVPAAPIVPAAPAVNPAQAAELTQAVNPAQAVTPPVAPPIATPAVGAAAAVEPISAIGQSPVAASPATSTSPGIPVAATGPIPVQAGEAGTPAVRYHAPKWKSPARHSITFYFAIVVLLSVGFGGLMLMRPFLMTHGVGVTIVLAMLAFLPVIVIVTFITWIDNWEPEPMVLYVVAFMWGAGVSTIFSLMFNNMFGTATAAVMSQEGSDVVSVVVGAPLIEEAFKGLGVLVLLVFFAKNFNGPVDGIVYGMLIGLGFAFTENILYFGQYYDSLATVFRARAILNPFVHPLATAMTGLFVGLSIQQKSRTSLFYLVPTGYAIAVGLHALHNLSAVLNVSETTRMLYQIPIYLITTAIIMAARVAERREVMTALNEYAKAGWLTTNELSMIQTLPNRRQAVFWARNAVAKAGGDPEDGAEAMKRFQDELIQLGYARSRALHHGDVNRASNRQEEAERLELLGQLRKVFTGKRAAGLA